MRKNTGIRDEEVSKNPRKSWWDFSPTSDKMKAILKMSNEEIDALFVNNAVIEHIKKEIRQKIDNAEGELEELTRWSEGIVYKIKVKLFGIDQYFVAMKKRFDGDVSHEIECLKKANVILSNHMDIDRAKVPDFIWDIVANTGDAYVIMEYVNGKTLYALQLEAIIEELIPKIVIKENEQKEKQKRLNLNKKLKNEEIIDEEKLRSRFLKIENDTDAEKNSIDILKWAFDLGIISTIDLKQNYEKKKKEWFSLFDSQEWKKIQEQLRTTIDIFHENGFFHRDLWANPRNVMFAEGENGKKIPYIIDFWQSEIDIRYARKLEYDRGEWVYGDETETYVPDTNVLAMIENAIDKGDIERTKYGYLDLENIRIDENTFLSTLPVKKREAILIALWYSKENNLFIEKKEFEDFEDFLSQLFFDKAIRKDLELSEEEKKEITLRLLSLNKEDLLFARRLTENRPNLFWRYKEIYIHFLDIFFEVLDKI